jgi:hypothetical protein
MSSDFVPGNELEKALMLAARDPVARPAFLRLLLEANLFFLTPEPPASEGTSVLKEDRQVSLVLFEGPSGPFTPCFSSQARVGEVAQRMQQTFGVLGLPGQAAFEMLAQGGSQAILNPGFAFGKEFTPEEIKHLAAGNLGGGETLTVAQETQVLLGQPSPYPQALVDALGRLFANHPSVEAAYLAQIHDPSSGLPPHPIIGLVSSTYDQVVREAGVVANSMASGTVDFIPLSGDREGVAGYLYETKPFYRRPSGKPRWKFW